MKVATACANLAASIIVLNGKASAKRSEVEMTLLKTIVFTVLVPGTVTVLVPYRILSSESTATLTRIRFPGYLGILPMLVGISIYIWCAWDFTFAGHGTPAPIDPPKQLVVRGLYKYTRNPMYVGVFLVILGEALLFQSGALLIYALGALFLANLFIIFYEEPTLRRKFGESYERYRGSVPRWIPLRVARIRH